MRRRKQATKRLRRKMTKIARRDAQTAVRGPSIAELQEQLDIRTRERDEALEQQAATAEVLKVISSSTGKLEPVFQTILENSITICEAKFGMFWLTEGHSFRCVALHGTSPAFTELRRREPIFHPNPTLLSPLGRIARSKQLEHVADCRAEQAYIEGDPGFVALVELAGARTILVVPILWDNELVGAVNIFRQEVRPFTDKQIGLLTSFASQAVIAIENTRLLNELRESLQQQTATADVLKVISSSPGNLEPVFQAILASATEICQTKFGTLNLFENNAFRSVALHNPPPQFKMRLGQTLHPHPDSGLARVARTKQVVHIEDITTEKPYLEGNQAIIELADLAGARTQLSVPMLKEDELLGSMSIYRQEVRPFTDKQIELVENFAAQAVIAIENTRLLNELRQRTHELAASLEDLRTTQDRLVQTQKLALLGQLTAGIAHEIKNPLNFVNNFSGISAELIGELQDTLKGMPLDDNARTEINELTNTLKGNFDKVVHHGRRADAIVKNMLQHSREGSGEHRVVDINALVEESLNLAWHGARAETQGFEIKLKQSFDPSAGSADIFPQDIRRALLNVISNGFYAATRRRAEGNGGDYAPTITASTKNLGDRVEIRIRDNGTGMPPDVKEKMFNPFFTTKPTGEGTGLGLSISHDIIVKQHGGSIEVDSQPGEFTEIRVILPRVAALLPERS
jgi:signal transduction histidine kinase